MEELRIQAYLKTADSIQRYFLVAISLSFIAMMTALLDFNKNNSVALVSLMIPMSKAVWVFIVLHVVLGVIIAMNVRRLSQIMDELQGDSLGDLNKFPHFFNLCSKCEMVLLLPVLFMVVTQVHNSSNILLLLGFLLMLVISVPYLLVFAKFPKRSGL